MIAGSGVLVRRAVRAISVAFDPHYDDRNVRIAARGSVRVGVALDVVGKLGRVTADITPGHLGEVLIEVRQGTERFLARASDSALTIHKHSQVIVVGSLGGRTVEVEPTDTLRLST
jgi:hypothetical protein